MNIGAIPNSKASMPTGSRAGSQRRKPAGIRWVEAAFGLFFAVLLGACTTAPVVMADYDRTADFTSYRTYGFFEPLGTDSNGYETLVTQALKSAVRHEMEARGYTYAHSNADLLINFTTKLEEQTRIHSYPAAPMYYGGYGGWGYGGWGYGGWGWGGWGGYDTYVDQYLEGTLNINIVDARRKRLVWEGVVISRISDKHVQNRQAALNAAVAGAFTQYPFRAGN
jgi:hypothetical protein